jgi:hypothetical protein
MAARHAALASTVDQSDRAFAARAAVRGALGWLPIGAPMDIDT